jgi:hypothetical protein
MLLLVVVVVVICLMVHAKGRVADGLTRCHLIQRACGCFTKMAHGCFNNNNNNNSNTIMKKTIDLDMLRPFDNIIRNG